MQIATPKLDGLRLSSLSSRRTGRGRRISVLCVSLGTNVCFFTSARLNWVRGPSKSGGSIANVSSGAIFTPCPASAKRRPEAAVRRRRHQALGVADHGLQVGLHPVHRAQVTGKDPRTPRSPPPLGRGSVPPRQCDGVLIRLDLALSFLGAPAEQVAHHPRDLVGHAKALVGCGVVDLGAAHQEV